MRAVSSAMEVESTASEKIQSITVLIDMHGSEDIEIPLIIPPGMTHTLVSTIGKLGCSNVYYECQDKQYVEEVNQFKRIFQTNETIHDANKILQTLRADTFDKQKNCDCITEPFSDDLSKFYAENYHKTYTLSANKTRIIRHEKVYSINLKDTYELKHMGVYVLETYNVSDPNVKHVFDGLKLLNEDLLPLNLCDYVTAIRMQEVFKTLKYTQHYTQQLPLVPDSSMDILEYFLTNSEMLFQQLNIYPTLTNPVIPVNLSSALDIEMSRTISTNFKVTSFTLSMLLKYLGSFGFRHVNIVDTSCRYLHIEGTTCPDYMIEGTDTHNRLRSVSLGETEQGLEFLNNNPNLGGIEKPTRKHKKNTKKRKRKTKKTVFRLKRIR
jgi:hypothetical protein